MIKIDTLIIHNDCEVIDVIHGNGESILTYFKKNPLWEQIMEDCSSNLIDIPSTLEEIVKLYDKNNTSFNTDWQLTLLVNKDYSPRKQGNQHATKLD